MRRTLESDIAAVFLSVLAMLSIFSVVVSSKLHALQQDSVRAEQSRYSLVTVQGLYRALLAAESGQRGYLLTSRPAYLDSYTEGQTDARNALARLARDQELGPQAQASLHRLSALSNAKLAELQQTIDLEAANRHQQALAIVESDSGRQSMRQSREVIESLIVAERSRIKIESDLIGTTRISLDHLFRAGVIILGLLLIATFHGLRRTLQARARVAKALRSSEAQLQTAQRTLRDIVDNVPAVIAEYDLDHRCLFMSEEVIRTYLLDPTTLVGKTQRQIRGEARFAELSPHLDAVVRGESRRFEMAAQAHGIDRQIYQTLIPKRDSEGVVSGYYSMVLDITATKTAEIALAASKKRLQAIADNMPALIAYVDRDEVYRFVNERYTALFAKSHDAIVGGTMTDLLGLNGRTILAPRIAEALRGIPQKFDQDGARLGLNAFFHTEYIPDHDAGGNVCGFYIQAIDITERKAFERTLDLLARIDPLTGLFNRRQFDEKLGEFLLRVRRAPSRYALLYLDVDRFKSINDTYGHAAGDAVLVEFGARLKASVRSTDVVARLAGDEFVVLLPDLHTAAEASVIAEKIAHAVRADLHIPDRILNITTSIGIAFAANPEITAHDLFACADRALYKTKQAGRNGSSVLECKIVEMRPPRKKAS